MAGLDDESKLDIVRLYLDGSNAISFPEAKKAVIKAYLRIGQPSPFDEYQQKASERAGATQVGVNAGLLNFFETFKRQFKIN